ncbi:sensor histidine kinase [Azospirillum sp. ST 5-10]|uniref:sensor histidine kinase n=1 Tax=unclassified Azospirillum TaxID=2630922 RepID=UPI003F4A675F
MSVLHIDQTDTACVPTEAETDRQLTLLGRYLSYAKTLEDVMDLVMETARHLLRADGITFVLREGDRCHYADEKAISPLWAGKRFAMDDCISGWVMRAGEAVSIDDIRRDTRIPQDAYQSTFVRSMAMAPVRKDDPLAALGAYWRDCRSVSAAEVALLEQIADACALAIANLGLRRDREQLRAEKDAAERAGLSRSRFMAALSHDLHQPLQSLMFLASILERQVVDTVAHSTVGRIDQELASVRSMLDDVRALSNLECGGAIIRSNDVRIDDVLQRVETLQAGLAQAKGLRLTVGRSDARVSSEPNLLARMIGAIVEMAVRCTDQGEVRVGCRKDAGMLEMIVEGAGPGVPPDGLDLLETIGTQEAAGRRHPLALRLVIIKSLGAMLGHGVEVCSRAGDGIRFTVTVPLTDGRP